MLWMYKSKSGCNMTSNRRNSREKKTSEETSRLLCTHIAPTDILGRVVTARNFMVEFGERPKLRTLPVWKSTASSLSHGDLLAST